MQDSSLQDIKDRLNIADVISGYIQLKKAGVNYKAPCPFHHEKSPSLVISPQKQIWHCFGCGEGGDVFGFVMKYENLEFKDALKVLAEKAGVKLQSFRPENKHQQDEKELLLRINDFAARYYHQVLTKDNRGLNAMEYLKNRGLNPQTIERWQIGFAPDDFHALEQALVKKNVAPNDLIKAGVSSKNDRGQMYDRFRGRITFPIFNYFGETVGFSARILKDSPNAAKYVNSPETAIYNKSKTLFGLNFAKDSIRKKDEMILVEGQMDCISLHQSGFENVVASSGTAYNESASDFTSARRLTNNVKLCFDSDSAGQMALRKTGEMLLKQGFKVKVIELKVAKDPDELVKKSPGLWEKTSNEAERFLDFFINSAEKNFPADKIDQLNYLTTHVIPLLVFIEDPLELGHYIQKVSKQYDASEKDIRDLLKGIKIPKKESKIEVPTQVNASILLQKEVLGGLLFSSEFFGEVGGQLETLDFEDPAIGQLALTWIESGGTDVLVKDSSVAKEAIFMVESQLDELGGDPQKLVKQLLKSFGLLKINSIKRQLKALEIEIKIAEKQQNKKRVEELNKIIASKLVLRINLEKAF